MSWLVTTSSKEFERVNSDEVLRSFYLKRRGKAHRRRQRNSSCFLVLVDKDNKPQWKPKRLEDVSEADVAKYFAKLSSEEDLQLS